MKSRIFKFIYAIFIAFLAVALGVFMVIHISKGLSGANDKLVLGAYILMIVWALMKLYTAIMDIRRTEE